MPDLQLNLFLNFDGHRVRSYAFGAIASRSFFRRERGDDFFETRIAAERVPDREQF
jgi:hypothetical protein